MAAGKDFNASEYIQHHLTFMSRPVGGEGGFWSIHVDSVVTAIVLGILGIGFLWWVVKGATAGVPNRRQAFVELMIDFIDEQVKGIFTHGDRHRFVAPLALTVFVWVVLMNSMDFLPVDWVAGALGLVGIHEWRIVPTADVNTTFALALSVWLMMIGFIDEQVKGIFTHGDRHRFVAPLALTVFVWVVLMNSMDFLPVDWVAGALGLVGIHEWRIVPTADVNTTFALALSVWLMMI